MARQDTPRVRGVMLVVLGVILLVLVIFLVIALTKPNPSDSAAPERVASVAGPVGVAGGARA